MCAKEFTGRTKYLCSECYRQVHYQHCPVCEVSYDTQKPRTCIGTESRKGLCLYCKTPCVVSPYNTYCPRCQSFIDGVPTHEHHEGFSTELVLRIDYTSDTSNDCCCKRHCSYNDDDISETARASVPLHIIPNPHEGMDVTELVSDSGMYAKPEYEIYLAEITKNDMY